MNKIDYISFEGQRFGNLTVLLFAGPKRFKQANRFRNQFYFKCRCECGVEKEINAHCVLKGKTISCGCKHSEMLVARNTTHGISKHRLAKILSNMRDRCSNPKNKYYAIYGGKGIRICEDWSGKDKLLKFYEWAINNGYQQGLEIDRIDNEKGYEPSNCRWVTDKQQGRNTSRCKFIIYRDERRCLSEWCELLQLDYRSIMWKRTKNPDMSAEDLFCIMQNENVA